MTAGDDSLEVEQRFATVPEWLLRADVTSHAKVVYAALLREADKGNKMPGYARIRREWMAGRVSTSTISRAVTDLETYGALTVHRDTRLAAGPRSGMITRNTYFLHTSDPKVARIRPTKSSAPVQYPTGATVHRCMPSKGLEDLPTTTNAGRPPTPPMSFKAVVVEISDEHQAILGDLLELAAELRDIRRNQAGRSDKSFSDVNVARAVVDAIASEHGYDVDLIPAALRALAAEPETNVPQRLKVPGQWWDQARTDAFRHRRRATAKARADAITDCDQCDEYGWLLPDAEQLCQHTAQTKVC